MATSHQTSLFVTSPWTKLHEGVHVFGFYERDKLTAGLIVQERLARLPYLPYQGLLLDRRENPAAITALLAVVEHELGDHFAVWNAPAMLDVRPFQDFGTSDRIEYTYYTSPNDDMDRPENLTIHAGPGTEWSDKLIEASPYPEHLDMLMRFPDTAILETPEGAIVWGTDSQNRGYLLAAVGAWVPIVRAACNTVNDADLGSAVAAMRRCGRVKLRSIYGCVK